MKIAKIAVDVKQSSVDVLFDYVVPDEYAGYDLIGSRVLVEFGYRSVLGYIIDIANESTYDGNLKPISEILDFARELNDEQIELAKFVSQETPCLLTTALQSMLPSFLRTKYRKYLNVFNYEKLDADLAKILGGKKKVLIDKNILGVFSKVKREIDKGNVDISYEYYSYGKNKVKKYYSLDIKVNNIYESKSKKRIACLEYLKNNPKSTFENIYYNTGISNLLVKSLVKDGYVTETVIPHSVAFVAEEKEEPAFQYTFLQEQLKKRYESIISRPYLLYTNDDKFKMSFLLDITTQSVLNGKNVLIVTPTVFANIEIYNYFIKSLKGYKILELSSQTSNSDFYQGYASIKADDIDIVITTKIGITLPIENIGLIVMIDEESDTYTMEQSPKFSVKQVLKHRANYHQARLVYTTVAPSIEEYYMVNEMRTTLLKYLVDLKNDLNLIDMKEAILETGENIISKVLEQKLRDAIRNNTQSLIILNSKGYSKKLVCRHCGEVVKCPRCKISMVLYKEKGYVKCGYCDYKKDDYHMCSRCGSTDINELGFGLEKLKTQLEFLFPNANILQIDSESMSQKSDYDDALLAIEEGKIDIIIGTNMISRIITADRIALIGIIDADSSLNYSDFKSSEYCYRTLVKALNHPNTTVIVQGYNFEHYAVRYGISNNYDEFYNEEILYRKSLNYAPFLETSRLIITGEYKAMYHCANYYKKVFNYVVKGEKDILGPVYVNRLKGVQLIIKHNDFEKLKELNKEIEKKFEGEKLNIIFERYPFSFS